MLGTRDALLRLHEMTCECDAAGGDYERNQAARERCEWELPPWLLSRYYSLLDRYGESAVAPVVDGMCAGCYVQTPGAADQLWHDEGLRVCEQCGRLLYDERRVLSEICA